jgi:hypothetical protein
MPKAETLLMLACFSHLLFVMPAGKERPKNPVSEYGDSLINSYKGAQSAADQANLDALKAAVSAYRAANESYPKSLQEVGNMAGTQIDLSKYDYDPYTGTVTLKSKQ